MKKFVLISMFFVTLNCMGSEGKLPLDTPKQKASKMHTVLRKMLLLDDHETRSLADHSDMIKRHHCTIMHIAGSTTIFSLGVILGWVLARTK